MERWPTSSTESWSQLSSRDNMGCMGLSSNSFADIGVPIDLRRVSGNLGSCLKEVKPLAVYDGVQGIALERMQQNWV